MVFPNIEEKHIQNIVEQGLGIITTEKKIQIIKEPKEDPPGFNLWYTYNSSRRMVLLQKHTIKGRTKAYSDPELALKLLVEYLGEDKFVEELRANLFWGIRPHHEKNDN